ncbi:MAG: hypothetical protein ACJ707_05435 [Nitrososphaera sp.]
MIISSKSDSENTLKNNNKVDKLRFTKLKYLKHSIKEGLNFLSILTHTVEKKYPQ